MLNLAQDVGTRIAQLREDRGLSRRALAKLIDINPGTIAHIEHGTATHVSYDILEKVARVLGVEPQDFFCFPWPVAGRTPLRHVAHDCVRLASSDDLPRVVEALADFADVARSEDVALAIGRSKP